MFLSFTLRLKSLTSSQAAASSPATGWTNSAGVGLSPSMGKTDEGPTKSVTRQHNYGRPEPYNVFSGLAWVTQNQLSIAITAYPSKSVRSKKRVKHTCFQKHTCTHWLTKFHDTLCLQSVSAMGGWHLRRSWRWERERTAGPLQFSLLEPFFAKFLLNCYLPHSYPFTLCELFCRDILFRFGDFSSEFGNCTLHS